MKKIKLFITITMLLFSSFIFGQTKLIDINGFGILKIDMSIDSIITYKCEKITSYDYYIRTRHKGKMSSTFVELIRDTTEKYSSTCSLDKRVRTFHIGQLQVSNNVILNDITLSFFNNKLYKIHIGRCLNEELTIKYGKGIEKLTYTETTKGIDYKWNTSNKNSLYCSYKLFYYNGNFNGKQEYTILVVSSIEKIVNIEEERVKKSIENREKLEKTKQLSDF